MAYATFLTVFIIFMIASGLTFVLRMFSMGNNIVGIIGDKNNEITQEEGGLELFEDIRKIYIKHGAGSIVIKSDNVDKVSVYLEDSDDSYELRAVNNTLNIKNNRDFGNLFKFNWNKSLKSKVIITLPINYGLEAVEIDGGAGDISVRDFQTDSLIINAGAGLLTVNNVIASEVDVDGGAGNLTFQDVEFTNSDINGGVGSLNITGRLLGRNSIGAGVGEVKIKTQGSIKDYDVTLQKGIGGVLINGSKYDDGRLRQANAKNSLDVSGGVGRIAIDFLDD